MSRMNPSDKAIEYVKVAIVLVVAFIIFGQLCPVALNATDHPQAKQSIEQVCTVMFQWMPKLIQ